MADTTRKAFLKGYSKSIMEGTASVFIGAGFSHACGYVDWKGLMREIAEELDLDVDKEVDLVAVAQYHVNKTRSRSRLNQLLIDEFTKDAELTDNHRLLAALPIHTVWTTNYDDLLERSFEEAAKRIDVKRSKEDMALTVPRRAVTIYKMHGCKTKPSEAVLTKEDYEAYDQDGKRRAFSLKLQGDLLERTFLFLGFSFSDPNINYILSRIRLLLGENQRQHFCIMRSPRMAARKMHDKARMQHRLDDLKRYSIQPILIDQYSEITDILGDLNKRSHYREVFVSGSADDFSPLGKERVEDLCRELGKRLIREGYNLVSGYGKGIGGPVIMGAVEALDRNEEDRLILRPFPRHEPNGVDPIAFERAYRESMVSSAGVSVFLCGNKMDNDKKVVADGVLNEFEIAKRLGRVVIPIGATGHAATRIWTIVMKSAKDFFPQSGVMPHLTTLGDVSKSNEELLKAVFAILKTVTK